MYWSLRRDDHSSRRSPTDCGVSECGREASIITNVTTLRTAKPMGHFLQKSLFVLERCLLAVSIGRFESRS
jgi:hypothetical protein